MSPSFRDALEQLRQLLEPLAERFELDDPGRGLVAVIPVVGGTFIHPLSRATIPWLTVYGAGPDMVKILEPRFLRTLPRMPVAGAIHPSQFCAYVAKSLSQRLGELGAVRDKVAALGISVDLEHDVLRLQGRVELRGIRVRVTAGSAEALVVTALGERDLAGMIPRPERTLALTAAPTRDLDELARLVDRLEARLRGEAPAAAEPAPASAGTPPPAQLSPWDTPPAPVPPTPAQPVSPAQSAHQSEAPAAFSTPAEYVPRAQEVPAAGQPVEAAGATDVESVAAGAPPALPAMDAPAPPAPVATEASAPESVVPAGPGGGGPPGAGDGEEDVLELTEPVEDEAQPTPGGTPQRESARPGPDPHAGKPQQDEPAGQTMQAQAGHAEQPVQAEPVGQGVQAGEQAPADQQAEAWRVAQPVVPQQVAQQPAGRQPAVQQPLVQQPAPAPQQAARPAADASPGAVPIRELFDKLGSEAEVTAHASRLRLVVPVRIVQGAYTFYLEQAGPTSFKGVLQSPSGTRHPVAFDLRGIEDIKEIVDRVLMGR